MKREPNQKRIILRVEVLPRAVNGLVAVVDRNGMTNVAVCSRVFEWLDRQPEIVQASILGLIPEGAGIDVTTAIMKEFMRKPIVPPTARELK